jgi:hypothetical protein
MELRKRYVKPLKLEDVRTVCEHLGKSKRGKNFHKKIKLNN